MKRFTETLKWSDPWFRKLSPRLKCLWMHLVDACDCAGVLDPDWELISFQIGEKVTEDDVENFGDRVGRSVSGKLVILSFIQFQYGKLSQDCKAHAPVFKATAAHDLDRVSKGYPKAIHSLKEKEKDKDTEKDIDNSVDSKPSPAVAHVIPDELQKVQGFTSEWENFKVHRRRKRAPMTKRAEELMLSKLSERPEKAMQALQTAMQRGWTGFEWEWMENSQGKPKNEAQRDQQNTGLQPVKPKFI